MTTSAIHTLLGKSIDYAGLFPPARLHMGPAVDNYRRYSAGHDRWALGRFILPASRLAEFEQAAHDGSAAERQRWRLSALMGPNTAGDLDQIDRFNQRHTEDGMVVDTLEAKADTPSAVQQTMSRAPKELQVYFEVTTASEPGDLLLEIARLGARAKVRTGGITPEAFPSTANLARFIHSCVRLELPFKATAGLHHALRAEYSLTYEPDSGTGVMFGFLNVFLATALAGTGRTQADLHGILEESSPAAIRVDDEGITWRDQRLDTAALRRSRALLISFGSCSFTEPMAELQSLT